MDRLTRYWVAREIILARAIRRDRRAALAAATPYTVEWHLRWALANESDQHIRSLRGIARIVRYAR